MKRRRKSRWWITELNKLAYKRGRSEPTPSEERKAARSDARQSWLPGLAPPVMVVPREQP